MRRCRRRCVAQLAAGDSGPARGAPQGRQQTPANAMLRVVHAPTLSRMSVSRGVATLRRTRSQVQQWNAFKTVLQAAAKDTQPAPLLGLWASAGSPQVTELVSLVPGLSWLVIDMEHAPNTLPSVLAQLQAAQASGTEAVVRVPCATDPVIVKQVLDLGVRSIMFPAVESAAEAAAAVASTRYPPRGCRGVMTTARMSGYAVEAGALREYYERSEREMCVVVQVESLAAVEAIPEMAAVDGVDAIFLGPSDLAASMGHLGNPAHPDVGAAMARAFALCSDAGIASGSISADEGMCRSMVEQGATFVAVGTDLSVLGTGLRRVLEGVAGKEN